MSNRMQYLVRAVLLVMSVVLLASCSFPGVVSTSQQLPQVSQTPHTLQLPPIRFPQDEGAHAYLTEWWYYTGHMKATDNVGRLHQYGFELVIFQSLRSDLPPIYAAHFAISDITRGSFHFDQRRLTEPNAIIPDGTSTKGIDVSIGDWSIRGVNGQDHLKASMTNYAIDVNLSGRKPAILHNGNGLITFGLGGFSYYYSRPNMVLSGIITDHGQPLAVSGESWMDHQWGNLLSLLGGGGWDWYSIQLNNNTEMMLYFIRDASGNSVSTYATYIDGSGKYDPIAANTLHTKVLDHWRSPTTGTSYPSGWLLDINSPQLQVSLTLVPQLKDQELLVYQSTGNSYWEGAVTIAGQSQGRTIQGEGYVELTGYAHGSGPQTS
ncbi:MAG: hypothetical protein JO202_06660 [Ktedonobacteraceae bacterium]|nr:hypothetical protein [Ktedonobacteraceae bacterium]